MSECHCWRDRGDGTRVMHRHAIQVSIADVQAVVAGKIPGVRLEDPRGERIVVMGSFMHFDRGGGVFRLDHVDRETDMIHAVWPD